MLRRVTPALLHKVVEDWIATGSLLLYILRIGYDAQSPPFLSPLFDAGMMRRVLSSPRAGSEG